jgi:hypothetical protein
MKLNLWFFLLLSGAAHFLTACVSLVTYSAEPIEAWIINADTKHPIEGAVVVAHWALEESTLVSITVRRAGDLVVMETVTDKNGRFRFPAWGPIRHWGRSRLTYMDPEILIFKSGYEFRRLANSLTAEAIGGKPYPVRRSEWNGKTIKLNQFHGSLEEYARLLAPIDGYLNSILNEDCGWKAIPRMILAISEQSEMFRKQKIYMLSSSIEALEVQYSNVKSQCGSVKDFFRGYKP